MSENDFNKNQSDEETMLIAREYGFDSVEDYLWYLEGEWSDHRYCGAVMARIDRDDYEWV